MIPDPFAQSDADRPCVVTMKTCAWVEDAKDPYCRDCRRLRDDLIHTYEEIGKFVGYSAKTCRAMARFDAPPSTQYFGRLPVWEYGGAGHARKTALRAWMLDQVLPAGMRAALAKQYPKKRKAA